MPLSVNGELIDDSLVRAEANSIRVHVYEGMEGEEARAVEARVKEWARENVIERVLLRQAAAATNEPVERFLDLITKHVARPRNKDIVEYYRKHREELWAPETVRASHIVKVVDAEHSEESARAGIADVHERLQQGADFGQLVAECSDRPANGGSVGLFRRGQMAAEFENAVFALAPGETSEVFRTEFGFHIARVDERREAGIPRLEQIRAELDEALYQEKRRKVIEQYLDRLRARAEVQVV